MPIIVKDYKWSETEYDVCITLPLKGVKAAKADIFTTSDYIKVNYPPYLFEVIIIIKLLFSVFTIILLKIGQLVCKCC